MIRSTDPEDMDNKYTRVLTCSLLAMRQLLHKLIEIFLYDQVYRSRRHGEQVYKGTDMFSVGHETTVTLVNRDIFI